MGLWMIRGGGHGQYEQKFLDDSRVYLTWSGLEHDLSAVKDRAGIREIIEKFYPGVHESAHLKQHRSNLGLLPRHAKRRLDSHAPEESGVDRYQRTSW
jgi:restriction system protein